MTPTTKTIVLSDGREITLQTGKLAEQADGAVELRLNNTMLLATVCSAKEADEGVDFMPLTVEYKEKFSAFGRFPGGFTRREGRASDYEVLTARLVDRVLRPLFPSNYHANTIVHIIMFSSDGVDAPDALAGLAASAAIAVSDVPFEEPIAEVRVARIDGQFVIDPTFEQIEKADMELMVGATYDNIMMVEGEMDEVSEDDLIAALKAAHEAIKPMCLIQKEMAAELGVTKREYCHETDDEELHERVRKEIYPKCYAVAQVGKADKQWRNETFQKAYDDFMETIPEEEREEKEPMIKRYYEEVQRDAVRRCILDEHIRLDGRKTNEIRPILCEPDYLPYPHGSALFKRGETQALATVTLGTKDDEKLIDDVLRHENERFLLHYNFPAFSTGEARAPRGVSRREIGHGNLAHRALKRMIPEDNPYCIRIVSEILSSNGSSSMATVCAGCMALLDAGIKLKKPVAGIAMGLITDEGNVKHAVLSDILGDEDHLGDMDFKVTGTVDGITATQMDIKCDGLPYEILEQALHQAKEGRLHILNLINEAIPEARADYKPHVPRIVTMTVDKEFIGAIIGKGGEVIQGIQEETGTTISIEEVDGKGIVEIAAANKDSINAAVARIEAIIAVPEEGQIYTGKVVSILEFGAFVEFMPGRDGLLHISEISWDRLENMEASGLHEGDEVTVKLIEIDKKTGKFRLSMRALQDKPEGYDERRQGGNGGPRGPRPGGNGGPRGPRPNGGNRPAGGSGFNRGPRPNGPRRPRRDDRRDDE
ncbi:MAG: polyribonucleotide nucleotidyltransferase [Muribaculaceae bacterium]|nr:polyribonucleotide nucleotidyltransferase [Muribaculaceae bacterium]